MKKVAVIGLGNFGYALLHHLDSKQGSSILCGFDKDREVVEHFKVHQCHPRLFLGASVSSNVSFETDLKQCVKNADYIITAVPSNYLTSVFAEIKPLITKPVVIINTAKALNYQTGERFSEIADDILHDVPYDYALIAGGTIAADFFKHQPLGADIASENPDVLDELVELFSSDRFFLFPTTDLTGVEYASAFKNVISILAGMINGLGYSYGSETYTISRAAYEVERLVLDELGGQRETFSFRSQCWGNDLWMSCTGNTRNREFGTLIGKGSTIEEALEKMAQQRKTVEGIFTIKILDTVADLKKYPLLHFLSEFFNDRADLRHLQNLHSLSHIH